MLIIIWNFDTMCFVFWIFVFDNLPVENMIRDATLYSHKYNLVCSINTKHWRNGSKYSLSIHNHKINLAPSVSREWEWWKQQRHVKMFRPLFLFNLKHNAHVREKARGSIFPSVETYPVESRIYVLSGAHKWTTSSIIICGWRSLKNPLAWISIDG